jgi:hypothetical protein
MIRIMKQRHRIVLLWICTLLFLVRVMGQIWVGICRPPSLPPWSEWHSGVLPYPLLLLTQLLLLMFMAVVNTDQARGAGWFGAVQLQTRNRLRLFGIVYALAMIFRYAARMTLVPEARWLGGTIPIGFHLVLASWVILLGVQKR